MVSLIFLLYKKIEAIDFISSYLPETKNNLEIKNRACTHIWKEWDWPLIPCSSTHLTVVA